jgi:hypothetical protein
MFTNNYSLFRNTHALAQLVEALCHKPEGRGFDSRWCHWNFSLTLCFQPHYGPGVNSSSNRNEYQEYFLGVKATGADCLEIWKPQRRGTLRAVQGFLLHVSTHEERLQGELTERGMHLW